MESMGEVFSACYSLRFSARHAQLDLKRVAVILTQQEAETIHGNIVSLVPGSDEVQVAWSRYRPAADIGERYSIEVSRFPKPSVPEPGGEWLKIFDVPVIVIAANG